MRVLGDIWSENGACLFAVLLHYIDEDFKLQQQLAICIPFSDVAHTGANIKKATYEGLHKCGLGDSPEDVPTNIHVATPDEDSNMVKAWEEFEGAGCVCHRQQNCLKSALEDPTVALLVNEEVQGLWCPLPSVH